MAKESPEVTSRTWLGCTVVATADRLIIRQPIGYYGIAGLLLLLAALLPWVMVEVGLLDRAILTPVSLMMAAGILFFAILLGRRRILDRTTDSVRYLPCRLCALTAIRGVRVVERRIGKRRLERVWTVELEVEGGARSDLRGSPMNGSGARKPWPWPR